MLPPRSPTECVQFLAAVEAVALMDDLLQDLSQVLSGGAQ